MPQFTIPEFIVKGEGSFTPPPVLGASAPPASGAAEPPPREDKDDPPEAKPQS